MWAVQRWLCEGAVVDIVVDDVDGSTITGQRSVESQLFGGVPVVGNRAPAPYTPWSPNGRSCGPNGGALITALAR